MVRASDVTGAAMRRAVLAGVAALALCGPARAADFGIPIDIFREEFNIRATVLSDPVAAAEPVCTLRMACAADLGSGVVMVMGASADADMVTEVRILSSATPVGFQRFADGCIALVGLLSPEVSAEDRRTLLHEMNAAAVASGAAARLVGGRVHYDVAVRDDARLVFTAKL